MGWEPPLPGPLLHKCVEEREKTGGFALHEPAVVADWVCGLGLDEWGGGL
jgi:hypothetical protein